MRVLRIAAAVVVAVILVIVISIWATVPSAGPGMIRLPAKTSYTKGSYFLYLQPWGGESFAPTRLWARRADNAIVDFRHFPANTEIHWRWPPFAPGNDVGVWAYDALSYGSYDGGEPEKAVTAIKVRNLKAFSQDFTWSMSHRFGEANVLTEFYLDPDTVPFTAHKVEIGFLLHVPDVTRRFFNSVRFVGNYVDTQGRRWKVAMGGTYCMFVADGYGDVSSGQIDMLHALRWLQTKGIVSGEEMLPGIAFGAEAVTGTGSLTVQRWQVVMK